MDLNYKPDGWLGLMIGTKLFFDFSGKYEFQDKMGDLLKEIDTMYPAQLSKVQQNKEQSQDDVDDNTDADGHERSTKENALYIDSSPKTYLLRGCIPATICADELTMLVEMRQEAPEFFYKCLYDMYKIRDPVKLAKFVKTLRELRE
ncbi:hypothetical protein MAR_005896 [Mya arenaria]|uniref:Uncharacterized protein n=1 Tax=Mya arenaria TaxID=6604 RepID=A0ABY7DEG3_MYAAR|nr:hypothetical protein MAR_005896 [Mya arenaria]